MSESTSSFDYAECPWCAHKWWLDDVGSLIKSSPNDEEYCPKCRKPITLEVEPYYVCKASIRA
jgi:hypothetical protein